MPQKQTPALPRTPKFIWKPRYKPKQWQKTGRPPPKPRRTTALAADFGASGWMKVELSEKGEEAVLRVLSFGGDVSLGAGDIEQALKQCYNVRAGLDRQMIAQLADRAAAAPDKVIRGHFPVAHSTWPHPATTDRVHYTFLDGLEALAALPYERLRTAFELETLEEVLAQQPLVRPVIPGEKLAVVDPVEDGAARTNIFGGSQKVEGPEALLKAGANVHLVGNSFLSDIFGYVCLLDGEISVVSPLWISPDNVAAHFIHFPQVGAESHLVREWLDSLLEQAGITSGIQEAEIAKLLNNPPGNDETAAFLLACGKAPVPGADAHLKFAIDIEKRAGEHLEDDRFDFRERNAFVAVKQGQLLAEIFPAKKGQTGIDLKDQKIPVAEGRQQVFIAGENIRTEYGDGRAKFFYAKIAGNVRVKDNTVDVNEVIKIVGDVDYNLGNIEAGKDVYITGTVRSGFAIRAKGSVSIGGAVEAGCSINAQGDIVVAQGIVGETTQIVALGDVHVKYVHNSAVMARGDVVVGSYLLNAHVQAGKRLAVRSGGEQRGGSIVGGQVTATAGIWATRLGSFSTDRTTVAIGTPPDIAARLRKLDKGIEFCRTNILRAFRTLGMHEIDAAHFKTLIEKMPRYKRDPLMKVLRQLKGLTRTREKSLKLRRQLEQQSAKAVEKAEIKVAGVACADSEIYMSGDKLVLSENVERAVFFLSREGINYRGF